MIKLEVEDYCHRCVQFEADVEKPVRRYINDVDIAISDTIVRCEHRYRCANNVAYLKQTLEKKEGQDES